MRAKERVARWKEDVPVDVGRDMLASVEALVGEAEAAMKERCRQVAISHINFCRDNTAAKIAVAIRALESP